MITQISDKNLKINLGTSLELFGEKIDLSGKINLDFINGINVEAVIKGTTSKGIIHNIKVNIVKDVIYINFAKKNLKLTFLDLKELINTGNNNGNTLSLISIINNVKINVDDMLHVNIFGYDLAISETLLVNVSDVTINKDIKLSNISANIQDYESINFVAPDVYYDMNTIKLMTEYVNILLKEFTTKQLSFNLSGSIFDVNNNEYKLNSVINLDITNGLSLKVLVDLNINIPNYNNHYFDITINNNYLYVIYKNNKESQNSLKIKGNLTDLKETINTLKDLINFDFAGLENNLSNLQNINIVSTLINLDFEKILTDLVVDSSNLNITLDKSFLGGSNDLNIVIKKNQGIESLTLNNLFVMNYNMNLDLVKTNNYEMPTDPVDPETYYDLSILNPLIKSLYNTATITDYSISSTVNVKASVIGIPINMNLNISANIKRIKGSKEPVFHIQITNIPVIVGVNNDVKYIAGDTNGGQSRTLDLYLVDSKVYMHRYEYIGRFLASPRFYQKKLMVSLQDFSSDIVGYLLGFGFGFYGNVMNSITGSMGSSNPAPIDFTNVIKAFNYSETDQKYHFTINLRELTHNDKLDTFDISLGTSIVNEKEYLSKIEFNVHMPLASGVNIDISSNDVSLNKITEPVDLSNVYTYRDNYTFEQNVKYEHYGLSGDVWAPVNEDITIYFEENGGPLVNDLVGKPNDSFVLPTYDGPQLINGQYHRFDGWYKDPEFKTLATETKFGAKGYSLYAKWTQLKSYTINVYTGVAKADYTISAVEGFKFALKEASRQVILDGIYYEFVGFYLDSNFNNLLEDYIMPSHNLDVYLRYQELPSRTLTVYTQLGEQKLTVPHGRTIKISELNIPTNFGGREHYFLGCSKNNDNIYITEIFMDSDMTIYAHFEEMYKLKYSDGITENIDMWVRKNYKFTVPTPQNEGLTKNTSNLIVNKDGRKQAITGYNISNVKHGDVITITSDYTLVANFKNVYELRIHELVRKVWGKGGYIKEWYANSVFVEEGIVNMEFDGYKHYTSYTWTKNWFDYATLTMPEFSQTINVTNDMNIYWTVYKTEA